jgi:hypothetical protein
MKPVSSKQLKKRRSVLMSILLAILVILGLSSPADIDTYIPPETGVDTTIKSDVLSDAAENERALDALDNLLVKGRAPKTGYSRSEFGDGWAPVGNCDVRNIMLSRGMTEIEFGDDDCTVLSGILADPYTGATIQFVRGSSTSADVQIDHVVALSDAWQKGAQSLSFDTRSQFANDPLNLLAVDGDANQQKGDSDAASWLPPNKSYRCMYVARQIAVKAEYALWVTSAEQAAMRRVLSGCGEQVLPVST